jgi:carbon-monoxide dehydrogenase large subunit
MIVHGQIHGGVAQGIGQTLMEHIVYDEAGQLVTGTFQDYALPRAADLPEPAVAFHVVPSPSNPLGVKGCGEAGVTGSIAAVSNAVRDALDRAGVHAAIDMPFTPERTWRVLNRHASP